MKNFYVCNHATEFEYRDASIREILTESLDLHKALQEKLDELAYYSPEDIESFTILSQAHQVSRLEAFKWLREDLEDWQRSMEDD